jgi:hypothetical protein
VTLEYDWSAMRCFLVISCARFKHPNNAMCCADSTVAETARDVALMILSRSYHQTHPDALKAQHGPAHMDGKEGAGCSSSTSGSAGKAQHAQLGAAAHDSSHSPSETLPQLLGRLRTSEYLYSDSPAMRGYGARILLQYVQRTPTTPSKVTSGSTNLFSWRIVFYRGCCPKEWRVVCMLCCRGKPLWQRIRNTPRQQ